MNITKELYNRIRDETLNMDEFVYLYTLFIKDD